MRKLTEPRRSCVRNFLLLFLPSWSPWSVSVSTTAHLGGAHSTKPSFFHPLKSTTPNRNKDRSASPNGRLYRRSEAQLEFRSQVVLNKHTHSHTLPGVCETPGFFMDVEMQVISTDSSNGATPLSSERVSARFFDSCSCWNFSTDLEKLKKVGELCLMLVGRTETRSQAAFQIFLTELKSEKKDFWYNRTEALVIIMCLYLYYNVSLFICLFKHIKASNILQYFPASAGGSG